MPQLFEPMQTIEAWQLSNPPILQLAALRASLSLFDAIDFQLIRSEKFVIDEIFA